MKRIYKSPENIESRDKAIKTIFLAGSIEMDKAINWQEKCEKELTDKFILFNPRRENWDKSWKQIKENTQFYEQVNWELDALEKADIIIMFFANETISPISLLEFGLYAKSKKMMVVVENEFWRKGNIDIVCEKYRIEQYNSLEKLIEHLNNQNI
ncbi:MAG: nucleoside 2-deoxyribosyltransferase domain-containing protein [Pseudarcicella sp.]|nr:nucleoside 2-deoxyribosyltransferase domain-containing protein [Pseudarcicella sp.]MBP6409952.1 nucleoside 2-deoxyribosyltransferase domain-containing protein [Pseudarcicella sp.]